MTGPHSTGDLSVLLVNPTLKPKHGVKVLSRRFAEEGHSVTLMTPRGGEEYLERHPEVRYRFFPAGFVPGVRYTVPSPRTYAALRREAERADVVHVYSYFYLPCLAAAVAGRRAGRPVVVTVDSLPGVSWGYGHAAVDGVSRVYTETLGRATFRAADAVAALGTHLLGDLDRFVDPGKVRVVPNGVDTDRFRPPERRRAGERVELLYVGRLDRVKGVEHLLDAAALLEAESPGRFALTLVGDGGRRESLEERVRELGIGETVRFAGWRSRVEEFYRGSDVFVLPSLSEGQPTVLMEAQACGVPVVTTDVGCARDLVEQGEVVPARDPGALADAVRRVVDRETDPAAARRFIEERFSTRGMAERYEELYRELMEGRDD